MSSLSQSHRGLIAVLLAASSAILCSTATLAEAQNSPAGSAAVKTAPAPAQEASFPKWEVFGGYSFFYPDANLHYLNPGATLPLSITQESNPKGVGASLTYNFNRWLGLTGDFSGDFGSGEGGPNLANNYIGTLDDSRFYDLSIGPKLTYRRTHFAPFLEGLVGWQRLSSDYTPFGSASRPGFIGGAGIDVPLRKHFALRPIQADYVFSNQHLGSGSGVPATQIRGVRLQSGVVFMFGGMAAALPVSYTCSANPSEVFPGDPVTVTGSPVNLNPKRTATYSWTATGGKVSGASSTSNIDTAGLAPGTYTVAGHLTEGPKAGQSADCNATFTVKPFGPPAVLCSANPSAVNPGESSTITAQGSSPQNRPLTYSYSASSGQISGSSGSASLNTTGSAPGAVTVTCNVTDDGGQTASSTTTVTINMPPPPPAPKTETLCSINFGRDKRRPARVDNEAKACLDEVSLNLQRSSDARGVLVGNSDPTEKNADKLAAERAENAKAYLVSEKGIDASRIELRTGKAGGASVQSYLVPPGASFDTDNPDTLPLQSAGPPR